MAGQLKKTIVVFSAFFAPFEGGAERYVREVTKRLSQHYRFIILTGRYKRSLPKREKREGVEIVRLGLGLKADKYFFIFLAPFKAFFLKPDLVHAVLESYAGLALVVYKILRPKMPTLLTLQSGQVKMLLFLFKKVHRSSDKIQAISSALVQRAKDFGAKDVVVVPNGINLADFAQWAGRALKKPGQIICVAHLKKVKGLEFLIEAMHFLKTNYSGTRRYGAGQLPTTNYQLFIIGEGPERVNLEKQVKQLGLEGKVILKGKLPNEQIPKLLAESEVFVLPSLAEGLGIAVLEAQAAGVPVVASKVGGILDIVEDGRTGLLVEPKNPEQIAKAIARVLSEPALAKKMAQNGRANAQKYDWSVIAQRMNQIYQLML